MLFRQLTGKTIDGTGNKHEVVQQALQILHKIGPSHVIMSSIPAAKMGGNKSMLQMYASSRISNDQYQTFQIDFPHLEGCFTGTGDSFSALVLAYFHKDTNLIVSLSEYHFLPPSISLQSACEKAISVVHQILLKTMGKSFFPFI